MSEFLDSFWATYSTLVLSLGVNALLALSIWLTLSCGLLSLANAAFMGIGAYAAALLTLQVDAPFAVALAGGAALPALVALLIGIPTLRLSGVYLAMATLGFGEVVRVAILNMEITGGPLGLNDIPLNRVVACRSGLAAGALCAGASASFEDRPRLRGDQGG